MNTQFFPKHFATVQVFQSRWKIKYWSPVQSLLFSLFYYSLEYYWKEKEGEREREGEWVSNLFEPLSNLAETKFHFMQGERE